MKRNLWLVLAACLLVACGPKSRPRIPETPGRVDAPYQLESDDDLELTRERYESLARKDPKRPPLRAQLAAEYQRRVLHDMKQSPDLAFRRFGDLLSLWRAGELNQQALAPYAPLAHQIRKHFSPSGGDIEVVTALYALTIMEPQMAPTYLQEIDEIFVFGDEISIARYGSGALRARPIEVLEVAVKSLPIPRVVNRLIALYQERQEAITSSFRRNGADVDLLRIHGAGVLTSTRNIVRLLILSGRVDQALDAIANLNGIGDDASLRKALKTAVTTNDHTSWVFLASAFRETDGDKRAALLLCERAIAAAPSEALAYLAAGETARELGNMPLAIRYLERGLALDADHKEASEALAEAYENRVSVMAYSDRPNAAMAHLAVFERFHAEASKRFKQPIEPDLASAYAVMARGLVSLGDLEAANDYLARSIKLRPNMPALEYLGTIALRQELYGSASSYFERALALPIEGLAHRFDRIRLQRLAAETELAHGKRRQANERFRDTLISWITFLEEYDLAPAGEAEALIEMGKVQFHLEDWDAALKFFFRALAKTESASSHHAELTAFLINRDAYDYALDIYLDALGNEEVAEYYKIYMSMWLVGEAIRRGQEPDHHATQYLAARDGGLWAHHLARYAAGKGDRAALEAMATTRGRRAEFLFYSAILGPESTSKSQSRILLEEVVEGSMVFFFEYEMAKQRLHERP